MATYIWQCRILLTSLLNALTAASVVSFALAGLVPVTSLPSEMWNKSQTPGGRESILRSKQSPVNVNCNSRRQFKCILALGTMLLSEFFNKRFFQVLTVPMRPITSSPSVVNPVIVFQLIIGLSVDASTTPGKIAGP